MCGIAGFLVRGGFSHQNDERAALEGMCRAISHRGPDGRGTWLDDQNCVALGHVRLSILDLSAAGAQPMRSHDGRFVIVFNGEIYNHLLLRAELDALDGEIAWQGHSDTETLLEGFARWGIRATVERLVGMFAFAVWDRRYRRLVLGRDRLGEKPLYYGWQKERLLFGSELHALRAYPGFQAEIDRGALALMMRHAAIPAPYSIYRGVCKLAPGALLTVAPDGHEDKLEYYWTPRAAVLAAQKNPFTGTPGEAVDELEQLLKQSVGQQMLADVPLGAFLSGGVDSSTVVALMQAQHSRPVSTFSIGFEEKSHDEAVYASAVARHLGTQHTELYVSPAQALDIIPRLPRIYDEPFADSSQIPTFLVSQLARGHVTVSLSGDGGDELFGGYNRYVLSRKMWGRLQKIPLGLRRALARGILSCRSDTWDAVMHRLSDLGMAPNLSQAGEKLHKAASVMTATSDLDLYRLLVSQWADPLSLVQGVGLEPVVPVDLPSFTGDDVYVQQMMFLDLVGYLPDDILAKVDRAAMGVSLETRVPMLDHRVVEFAWRLPLSMKIKDGVGKWPLRQVLYRHVPEALVERPKTGFGLPLDRWLRGELRDWAEALLDESKLRQEGYFNTGIIRARWQEHLSGRRNWQHSLWCVLMFQAWLQEY